MPLFFCLNVYADAYYWHDEKGVPSYGDNPPRNSQAKDLSKTAVEDPIPMVGSPDNLADIIIVTKDKCPPCEEARNFLRSKSIYFVEKPLLTEMEIANYKKTFGDKVELPVLMIGDKRLEGFNQTTWDSSLIEAGYPKKQRLVRPNGLSIHPAP